MHGARRTINCMLCGRRQRWQIARYFATAPRLIFMYEPTGGLDVSVQAQIVDQVRRIGSEMGMLPLIGSFGVRPSAAR